MTRTRITRETMARSAAAAAAGNSDENNHEDGIDKDPALQGEGNYTAARRHRESVKEFIDEGRVEEAADKAAPESEQQAQELRDAEAEGRKHAKR